MISLNHKKMKTKKILISLSLLFLFASCSTPLLVTPVKQTEKIYEKENMEFIGFKNTNKNNSLLKNFGAELERHRIALNRQDFYMGVYSFQELENYKSTMRYISFVDVSSLHNTWDDAIYDKEGLLVSGWIIAGVTCFTLFPVYVPMMCASNKNYCQLDVMCKCTLYVYDTEQKEVVLSIPMEFRDTQVLKGQYGNKQTDRNAVTERGRNMLYNEFLKYFDRAYQFLDSKNK